MAAKRHRRLSRREVSEQAASAANLLFLRYLRVFAPLDTASGIDKNSAVS
jgi:hypothetical protein